MSSSFWSRSRSPSRKSRKRRSRTQSLSSQSGNEQDGGNENTQLEERRSSSPKVANADLDPEDVPLPPLRSSLPKPPIQLPEANLLPSSPPGINTPVPLIGEPSSDQGANKEQGQTRDRLAKEGSEGTDDRVHRVRVEAERTGWARLYDLVRDFDKNRIVDNKEDIDTLLVFAGLFSAVVTAFIIESYKNLQQQPEDLTNHILMQVAVQLSHLSINGNFVNSTVPDFATPSFQKPRIFVVINTLWILSLLIALITASLGILVKQWFHELLSYETHDPMERLKLRFFREAGVERWKVFAIASALPLLLQLALLFFFIGLAFFFHLLDAVVAWFTTGTEILWLGFLLFATLAPTFSSQCPYKTPFLKGAISQLRVKLISISWPRDFANWLYLHTSIEWLEERFLQLREWFDITRKNWEALEEVSVCKDGSLSLPVISWSKDLLQGERLRDSIGSCIRDIPEPGMSAILKEMQMGEGSRRNCLLPDVPYDPVEVVGSFVHDAAQDEHLRLVYFGRETRTSFFATLYFGCASFQSRTCVGNLYVISDHSCSAFIHLIQANRTSAAFSLLTMYSTRHRTLTDHPYSFRKLFSELSDSDRLSHGIGDQFLSNLLTATTSLVHSIWDQQQEQSGDRKIGECVEAIRANADSTDPVRSRDPIAFISVFTAVLYGLVPKDVAQRFQDEIYEVVCELAKIINGADGQLSTWSRKGRVEEIETAFWGLYLRHGFESPSSITLYLWFVPLHSKAYNPPYNQPISYQSLPTFIHFVQANPTSAVFSLLTMYSIRHRTLTDHPDSFDHLFRELSDSDKLTNNIGDQFLSNLLTATKSLIHSIWNQPQDESDEWKIRECIEAIRANADESDPVRSPDPIAFIYVFAIVLDRLVPEDVVQGCKGEIYEVMGEFAGIVVEEDGPSWPYASKKCVQRACKHFRRTDFEDRYLVPKLVRLIRTWKPQW